MKLNSLLLLTAILTLFGGIVIIFFPETLMSFFTGRPMEDRAPVVYIQWFGAVLFSLGVLTWRTRKLSDAEARRTVAISLLVYSVGGVSVTTRFQLTGLLNGWGWFLPLHLAVLGFCYAHILFLRRTQWSRTDERGAHREKRKLL